MKIKKVILFIAIFAVFVISGFIFLKDTSFYQEITKPSFAPTKTVFMIVWPILYLIQSFFIMKVVFYYFDRKDMKTKKVMILLIINGILNILYSFVFFVLKSSFGGFVITLLVLVTLIMAINKAKEIRLKEWKLELPYLLWNIFALVLSICIYILN